MMHVCHYLPARTACCSDLSQSSLQSQIQDSGNSCHQLGAAYTPYCCHSNPMSAAWLHCIALCGCHNHSCSRCVPWDAPLCCAEWLVLGAWPGPVTCITAAARHCHKHHQDTYLVRLVGTDCHRHGQAATHIAISAHGSAATKQAPAAAAAEGGAAGSVSTARQQAARLQW